jgi:hypothetical protein
MDVQIQYSLYSPPRKEPTVVIGWEGGWVQEPVRILWGIKKSLAPSGNGTLFVQVDA